MAAGWGFVTVALAVVWMFNLGAINDPIPLGDGPPRYDQNPSDVALYSFTAFLVYIAGMVLLFLEALTS